MYENQAFNTAADANKAVLSDDSQRSHPLSKDYHEMPKMIGVMTYNKDEGQNQASTLKQGSSVQAHWPSGPAGPEPLPGTSTNPSIVV